MENTTVSAPDFILFFLQYKIFSTTATIDIAAIIKKQIWIIYMLSCESLIPDKLSALITSSSKIVIPKDTFK